ncbi:MAG: GspE/PulE family protein [Candidatus Colwellbacteria bacterium]|nr:GspE/PulE family protein [Candidatus Colwellbacteria bacterium]
MPGEDKPRISNEIEIGLSDVTDVVSMSHKIGLLIGSKAKTTELIEVILSGALSLGVSDVHFEPTREGVKVRFRSDGVLKDAGMMPVADYKFVISRFKLVGGIKMNINEVAQDGRFTLVLSDRKIEVRISLNPSEYGETAVLRILDPKSISLDFEDIGFRSDDRFIVEKSLKQPNGMVLLTGPTGSGKTTTLYAFLRSVRSPEIKIITIEDPIEYHLDGIQQTQVDDAAGYTFSNGLRSLLRQDPDVILVGEIRDLETAEIAIHASLTGHIVFSTLHTNSASGAIPRLIDIGVKPQVIGPSLNVVIAERLVRRLCDHCKRPVSLSSELSEKIKNFISSLPKKVDRSVYSEVKIFEPVGCPECSNGYKGRIGIFEVLEIDNDFEMLIHDEASEAEMEKYALGHGFITLKQDGILKAIVGMTDFAEVERATGPIEW